MTQTIEQLTARVRELEEENARLKRTNSSYANLTKAQESQLTNLRQRLYQLKGADSAIDSERQANCELTEQLAAEQLNNKLLRDTANECRLDLLIQVHELADHIERANYCISDPDMQKQINGQREYAISVASKWNQNGNPFLANQPDTSALDAYVEGKVKEIIESHAPEGRNVTNAQHVEMRHKFVEQIATLTRQRDLAVEALRVAAEQIRKCDYTPARSTLLVALKESEGE